MSPGNLTLLGWFLNLQTNTLVLRLSSLPPSSGINLRALRFVTPDGVVIALLDARSGGRRRREETLVVSLNATTLLAIKQQPNPGALLLQVLSGLFPPPVDIPPVTLTQDSAQFVADNLGPTLVAAEYDATLRALRLTFDDIACATSVFGELRLHDTAGASPLQSLVPTTGAINCSLTTITVTLVEADGLALLYNQHLFKSASNSFVSLNNAAVTDVAGNRMAPQPTLAAVPVRVINLPSLARASSDDDGLHRGSIAAIVLGCVVVVLLVLVLVLLLRHRERRAVIGVKDLAFDDTVLQPPPANAANGSINSQLFGYGKERKKKDKRKK